MNTVCNLEVVVNGTVHRLVCSDPPSDDIVLAAQLRRAMAQESANYRA